MPTDTSSPVRSTLASLPPPSIFKHLPRISTFQPPNLQFVQLHHSQPGSSYKQLLCILGSTDATSPIQSVSPILTTTPKRHTSPLLTSQIGNHQYHKRLAVFITTNYEFPPRFLAHAGIVKTSGNHTVNLCFSLNSLLNSIPVPYPKNPERLFMQNRTILGFLTAT